MELLEYENQIRQILSAGYTYVSDVLPSQWTEQNMVMQKPFPGPFRYAKTPYAREIIDCLSETSGVDTIALMKGAQIGMSSGVIIPGIGWIIKNNPGNTYLSVGAADLVQPAMEKLDLMIDSTGLRTLIKPQVQRAKNNKTGDTNYKKEFPNGYVALGSANNHKNLRQVDYQFVFLDDVEAIKKSSGQSGDTLSMVEMRQASYYGKSKLFLVSTPELKEKSNIEPAFLKGDQRKYHIPCPCCGAYIELKWSYECEKTKKMVGITWQLDEKNEIIRESVGYTCYECYEFFDDKNKTELLNFGKWVPTAKPIREGYRSYHISSLYAPLGMFDWAHYVRKYLEAVPPDKPKDEEKYQTFLNVCLGLTYELEAETVSAATISKNTRDYEVGTIPERQSLEDGNGQIVLLTCACDLNGTLDDARLDYEVLAHSETGSTYSITHGSIGTFKPHQTKQQKEKEDRIKCTYEHGKQNSVWPQFQKILDTIWQTDTDKQMKIFITGMDTGYCEKEAFEFRDNTNSFCFGLKGDKDERYLPYSMDAKKIKKSVSKSNLYLVLGGKIKDELSRCMNLKWNKGIDECQPAGFCNFPIPSANQYTYNSYFSHFESEQRKIEKKEGKELSARWQKISPTAQNHLWDCRVYNIAIREVLMIKVFEDMKIKNGNWNTMVSILLGTYTE